MSGPIKSQNAPPPCPHNWHCLKSLLSSVGTWLNQVLQKYLLSIAMVALGLYLIYGVPQIANIWQQGPNPKYNLTIWFLFWIYVLLLAGYYIGAILIFTSTSLEGAMKFFAPVEFTIGWLSKRAMTKRSTRRGFIVVSVLCILVLVCLYFGLFAEWYSLSHIFWETTFLWLLMTAVWFACCWYCNRNNESEINQPLPEILRLGARFLACLCVGYLCGEIIWLLASNQILAFSYRNYAIWGVYQTLIFFILIARGADQLSLNSQYPVRFLTVFLVLSFFFFAQPWIRYDSGISATKRIVAETERADEVIDEDVRPLSSHWQAYRYYDFLIERVKQTEEYEPVVFVAASGGGSRAAIFSALILEGLAREKLSQNSEKYWGDQIVLISSVSGGSLASAHFVQRGMRQSSLTEDGNLQSSIRTDLVNGLSDAANEVSNLYEKDQSDTALPDFEKLDPKLKELIQQHEATRQTSKEFFDDLTLHLTKHPGKVSDDTKAAKLGWIIDAQMIDEISLDFMAPLYRGATSLITPRGNALRDFWTDRFDWDSPVEPRVGSRAQNPDTSSSRRYPLVLFNATNVREGSRLVATYTPGKDAKTTSGEEVLLSLPDGFQAEISLSQAVRLSSNFPFGFPAARVEIENHNDVEIMDGGIFDNTGLDTIHAFFKQLIHDAETEDSLDQNGNPIISERKKKAVELVELLKKRRVMLIEIDSGAKPEAQTDEMRHSVLSWLTTPLDALNNASYHSAEISKKRYLREINEIIQFHLASESDELVPSTTSRHIDLDEISAEPNIRFLCNYKEEPSSVMTAWALGPKDKASVIARFVLSWRKQQFRLNIRGEQYSIEKQQWKELADLRKQIDPETTEQVTQVSEIQRQINQLPAQVGSIKTQDLSSIRNKIGVVGGNLAILPIKDPSDFKKFQDARQNLIESLDSNNNIKYEESKTQIQNILSTQRDEIIKQTPGEETKISEYETKLNQLKVQQSALKESFEKMQKDDAAIQRRALYQIRQSKTAK